MFSFENRDRPSQDVDIDSRHLSGSLFITFALNVNILSVPTPASIAIPIAKPMIIAGQHTIGPGDIHSLMV